MDWRRTILFDERFVRMGKGVTRIASCQDARSTADEVYVWLWACVWESNGIASVGSRDIGRGYREADTAATYPRSASSEVSFDCV